MLFGGGSSEPESASRIYEQAGRRLLAGTPMGDIVDVPGLRRQIHNLETDVRILQKEVADLQKQIRHLMPDKSDDI